MGNCFGEPEPPKPRPRPAQPRPPTNTPRSQQQPTNKRVQSPSAPISSPSGKQQPIGRDEIVLGSSVSEKRELDNDTRWKQLLDKTTTNLIDISQNTQPLDGVDAQQRRAEHQSLLEETPLPQASKNIFSLPMFKIPPNSQLTQPLTPQDTEFMQQCSHELVLAFANMPIENCGDIVVSFDALG